MYIILFIIGAVAGFVISSHLGGHYEGHKREQALFFYIGEYSIHIHHYVWTGLLLIVLIILEIKIIFVYGFLAGATFHGLTYRDRFIFLYKTKDFGKIYKRFESPHWGTHLRRHARILRK